MKLRSAILVGVLLLSLVGNSWNKPGAFAAFQGSPHTISLGPTYTEAGPGEYASFTVSVWSMQDAFSGYVLVVIPQGLTVVNQPACLSGCGQPSVDGTEVTQIEASINVFGGTNSSLSFQVMGDRRYMPSDLPFVWLTSP